MAFKNEYVPLPDQEESEFMRNALITLSKGFMKFDRWTVDREREMVLVFRRQKDDSLTKKLDLWTFLDSKGSCGALTETKSKVEVSPVEVVITRSLIILIAMGRVGDESEIRPYFEEALQEYGKSNEHNLEHYMRSTMKLIDLVDEPEDEEEEYEGEESEEAG